VATVSDGFAVQTNVVRQDGNRGVLMSILKAGNASTLDVVSGIRKLLPRAASILPPQLKVTPIADQSVFVRGAISGVVREALIAGCLTAVMILLFIGSWRGTGSVRSAGRGRRFCHACALSSLPDAGAEVGDVHAQAQRRSGRRQ
jgi:multidrug efflux pump subunit AcrB